MITIGIDPGLERTGIAILKEEKGRVELIKSELIQTSSTLKEVERLEFLFNEVNKVINEFKIDFAAVEKIYFSKNVKTAMSIAQARGVILLALQLKKIPIFEYTPLEVKKALIGYGRGSKNQIQELVKMILKLEKKPEPDDIADAIAIAITHININKFMSKIK
ncbi:MAG TPA: crossover junction endodeoxyribonuclease RuvC [Spirochaetota bacterium]|nr:crossover junction endodeoxyribonuclease RuvC [Spirochaetota bacterium]HOL57928.1 crossover junction endodeoxyribonuclease RuvC [Spirochaetota bacterium]HPP03668.1 crossover junction endodeoxyribonuclease RuvC [Spirochaetota bacterium]